MLGRTARGDHAAFGALYDAIASPVFGTVLRVVRDPAQSEEVTQEVFIDVWRHAARFDPEVGSARNWIMTVGTGRPPGRPPANTTRWSRASDAPSKRSGCDGCGSSTLKGPFPVACSTFRRMAT